jgi:hypothetical protein
VFAQVIAYRDKEVVGVFVRFRAPLYFGLSYTTFDYSNLKISSAKINFEGKTMVSVDITNSRRFDGQEVVQYIRDFSGVGNTSRERT